MTATPLIRAANPSDAPALNRAINDVCAERRWLATVEGFTLAQTEAFIADNIARLCPHRLAFIDDRLVGWCDITLDQRPGYRHIGRLGMGVVSGYRGQGIGDRLLTACLGAASTLRLKRIELEVYTDNAPAIALYGRHGFETEGVKRKARKLDGRYQDIRIMARID